MLSGVKVVAYKLKKITCDNEINLFSRLNLMLCKIIRFIYPKVE